jgi:hypothetical protein
LTAFLSKPLPMTKVTRAYSLAIPVALLVIVLLFCGLTATKQTAVAVKG